jgi:hypothetical protein
VETSGTAVGGVCQFGVAAAGSWGTVGGSGISENGPVGDSCYKVDRGGDPSKSADVQSLFPNLAMAANWCPISVLVE